MKVMRPEIPAAARLLFLILFTFTGNCLRGQNGATDVSPQLNAIQSGVPFMTITPDSRSGGMGDAGVAGPATISSQHWNAAKYPFIVGDGGIALSYTPWLRTLIPDINLAYLSGYYRVKDRQVISASLRYFSLGQIIFTNQYGTPEGMYVPNEFAIDAGYSRLLTDHFSGGIVFRFIRSDLTGGWNVGGTDTRAAMAAAVDLGFYYRRPDLNLGEKDGAMSFGVNFSNMGNRITYADDQEKNYLPINMRLGGALEMELDDYNTLTFLVDLDKLMVPTPPVYAVDDSTGLPLRDANNNLIIEHGRDPYVPVPVGMVRSFFDAPGIIMEDGSRSVFREELHEITYSVGMEYWYRDQFAIRGGYFYEHETKGNRKFFTAGLGLRLNVFALDFSYLIPVKQNNPLANTLRFTLGFELGRNQF